MCPAGTSSSAPGMPCDLRAELVDIVAASLILLSCVREELPRLIDVLFLKIYALEQSTKLWRRRQLVVCVCAMRDRIVQRECWSFELRRVSTWHPQ